MSNYKTISLESKMNLMYLKDSVTALLDHMVRLYLNKGRKHPMKVPESFINKIKKDFDDFIKSI